MRIKNYFSLIVLGAGMMSLTACSHMHKNSGNGANVASGVTGSGNSADNAQTYAMNDQSQVSAQSNLSAQNNSKATAQNETYYFAFDNSKVESKFIPEIDTIASYLDAHPQAKVKLEGNTDNRGSREYNVALGWRRAQAVQDLLMQQGVNKKQMDLMSFGKEHPAVLGNNATAWALNRRVNLIFEAY